MKRSRALLLLPLLLLLCAGSALAEKEADEARAAARSNNAFAVDLYGMLRSERGNLFFSPYSVHAALSMARAGARGETAAQMNTVLHLPSGSGAGGHRRLAAALQPGTVRDGHGDAAKEVPAFALSIANKLWGQEGLPIKGGFLRALRESYGAPLERIDFRKTEQARERINAWVAENTRDRILNIVPEGLPTPDTLLALANAIYFKAAWKDPFKERWTKEAPFRTAAGTEVPVKMMHRQGGYRYAGHRGVRALEIDYRGRETSMVILLPKERGGLAAFEDDLDGEYLEGILGGLEREQVSVKLPRFEVTFPVALTETLPEMGMRDAFVSSKADFTGITEQKPLFIGAVLHKAFVAVDEAGTEAAAATVVMMIKGGPPPGEPIEFVADHPFLFLIRHKATGCILFMGRLEQP